MIDLKQLRENPERFKQGARDKQMNIDVERLVRLDEQMRRLRMDVETRRAEQKKIGKAMGPQIGQLKGKLKNAEGAERDAIEAEVRELEQRPLALKTEIQAFEKELAEIEPEFKDLWLSTPQPPDEDVPKGASEADNIEISTWSPDWFDVTKSFRDNRGFDALTHVDLVDRHGMVDFHRGVKMAGTRSYVMTGDGSRLQHAVLRFAFDLITNEYGFTPMTVPVIVREECMTGTGFFPHGRDQAYHIEETRRGSGHDLFLTGTGEVALMGYHADEILAGDALPLQYATVSTCFRREAGAAGRDTAGLYRIHQFEKVEQVVICKSDEAESRDWHRRMIGIVEDLLQRLELPYRLLQCCTGDLGPKNADMIDIECWMPSRGELSDDGVPSGAWGETHSASRLYDYQCRRLNLRYRDENNMTVFCHSLNNTVAAGPRILIPIIEMHQQEDGTIRVPDALVAYMGGAEVIGRAVARA